MNFLPLEIDGKPVYAGFWKRFCSIWIDCFVLLPFMFLFAWLERFNQTPAIILTVFSMLLFLFYNTYFNARFGATLGKLAVGIRITKPNGEKIGWKEAWFRSYGDFIFALIMVLLTLWALLSIDYREYTNPGVFQMPLAFTSYLARQSLALGVGQQVWIWSEVVVLLLNRRKRALHDFIAGTVVVQKEFVGIMSRRSFFNTDIMNERRSKLNAVLSSVPLGVILVGSLILSNAVWVLGDRDYPPPNTSDLVIERLFIPDAENAYTYFAAATNSLFWPTNASIVVRDILDKRGEDIKSNELACALIANNKETIEIIKKGLACRACQTPEVIRVSDPVPFAGAWRNISRIMALRAMSERQTGQYAESMQSCADLLRFGEMIQANPEGLVQHLVGAAILGLGFEQSRQLAYAGAGEDLLSKLNAQVNQSGSLDQGLIRALKVEYKLWARLIDDLKENYDKLISNRKDVPLYIKKHGFPSFMFQPNGTKYLFASRLRTSINNASLPYNQMKPVNQPENDLNIKGTNKLLLIISNNILGRSLVGSVLSNLSNILESKCKVECLAAATRLILACNAYKITSHELPDALESLVPKYMDSIPLDPYDGKPFRYSKSKAIVYSVGKDLKDSSGSTERPANEKSTSDYDKWKAEDIVFKIEKASD